VIIANDGQEGLKKVKSENPDLILLDVMMPKMEGFEVCNLLKNDARYSKIPIILFTAKALQADIEAGQDAGADAYITKPFEPSVLLAKIEELSKKVIIKYISVGGGLEIFNMWIECNSDSIV